MPGDQVLGAGKNGYFHLLTASSLSLVQRFRGVVNRWAPALDPDAGETTGPHLHGTPVFWKRTT